MFKTLTFVLVAITVLTNCIAPNNTFEKIPPGIWSGSLLLDRQPVQKYGDDRDIVKKFDFDAELPFNFEVVYDNESDFHIVIHNADERIKVQDIYFGRDKATAKDTLIIKFPIYDTYIKAIYEDGVIEGDWVVNYLDNYSISFKAVHGIEKRFSKVNNGNLANFEGKWRCTFEIDTEDEYSAVGIFKQDGQKVTGTFLTETGDYRYLEGIATEDKLYLSTFDGSHAYLFIGKKLENGEITGTFRSGSQYTTNWQATKDDNASIADAYQLTKVNTDHKFEFSFENTNGQKVSLEDDFYKNKIKLVQIMGTWCPNCMDETLFLSEYVNENPDDEVAIISIGFERYKDDAKNKVSLKKFKEGLNIKHEVLYGGYYDKKTAIEKFPQLDKIVSYPTLLFVDKQNKIRKIHTGFSGPATPGYEAFKKEFSEIIKELKNE